MIVRLQAGACAVAAVVLSFTEAGIGALFLFGSLGALYAVLDWSKAAQDRRNNS